MWDSDLLMSTGISGRSVQPVELGPVRSNLWFQTLSQSPDSCMSIKHIHLLESSPTLWARREGKHQSRGSNPELRWHQGYPYGGWHGKRVSAPRTIQRRSDDCTISRFLPSPLSTSSHGRSLSTSQTRFSRPHFGHRYFATLLHVFHPAPWPHASKVLQHRHAYLSGGRGQHVAT